MKYKTYLLKEKFDDFMTWIFDSIREKEELKFRKRNLERLKDNIFFYFNRQDMVIIADINNPNNISYDEYFDIGIWNDRYLMDNMKELIDNNFFINNQFNIEETTYEELCSKYEVRIVRPSLVSDKKVYIITK